MNKTKALDSLEGIREWLDEVEEAIENDDPETALDLLAGTIPDELETLREHLK